MTRFVRGVFLIGRPSQIQPIRCEIDSGITYTIFYLNQGKRLIALLNFVSFKAKP